MVITLIKPCENVKVEILDWMPQRVFDEYNEIITGDMAIEIGGDDEVKDAEVAEMMGQEFFAEYQMANAERKEEMRKEVRKKKVKRELKTRLTMKDQQRADRAKIFGMVKEITVTTDGEESKITDPKMMQERLLDLPVQCFDQIVKEVNKIEANAETTEKK